MQLFPLLVMLKSLSIFTVDFEFYTAVGLIIAVIKQRMLARVGFRHRCFSSIQQHTTPHLCAVGDTQLCLL